LKQKHLKKMRVKKQKFRGKKNKKLM